MPAPLNPILSILSLLLAPKSLNEGEDEEIAKTKEAIRQERANAIIEALQKRDIITRLPKPGENVPLI